MICFMHPACKRSQRGRSISYPDPQNILKGTEAQEQKPKVTTETQGAQTQVTRSFQKQSREGEDVAVVHAHQ